MNDYTGPERRTPPPLNPVSIEAVKNGAQEDVEELLAMLRDLLKWARRLGVFVGIGVLSFIFYAGAWYMKVNDHIETDVFIDANQDELIQKGTQTQARILGLIEGMDRRIELLEEGRE